MWWGRLEDLRDQSLLCVPWSLQGPANICLSNIYFSSLFELPSSSSKSQTTTLFSLSQDGSQASTAQFFLGAPHPPYSCGTVMCIKLHCFFFLLTCDMLIYFLEQPEEPRWVEDNFFLPDSRDSILMEWIGEPRWQMSSRQLDMRI